MKEFVSACEQHCNALVTLRTGRTGRSNVYLWNGVEGLLLEHGRNFAASPLPKGIKRGRMGQCYGNAGKLVMWRSDLFYCEGYAVSNGLPIPLPHGWACTKDGTLIDPTWKDGREYFGVVFKRKWFMRRARDTGYYGILFEDYVDNWLTVRTPEKHWNQKI